MQLARIAASIILALGILSGAPSTSKAEEVQRVPRLDVCGSALEKWCIAELHVTDSKGNRHTAKATGRHFPYNDWTWAPYRSVIVGPGPEFVFDSIEFESGIRSVTIQSFQFSKETKYCFASSNCRSGMEGLQIYVEPSSIDKQREIRVTEDRLPGFCPRGLSECSFGTVPWRLGGEYSFELVVQAPSTFTPIYTWGRTSNLDVTVERKAPGLSLAGDTERISVKFTPITLEQTDFTRSNPELAERALYSTDQPTVFISGSNNFFAQQFLRGCTFWGDLAIATNAMTISQPTWSTADESIDVVLTTPHLATDGTKTKGYLEVKVPDALAYCLWGIDTSNFVGGQVSMVYEDNSNPLVLTVTTTKTDSEFKFVSAGFHFSSPTAKIKMVNKVKLESPTTVESVAKSEVTPVEPVVISKASSKKTCYKGKKKVVVMNKKCPKGFSIRN